MEKVEYPKKHFKFPSTGQFHDAVTQMRRVHSIAEKDELIFEGTVKLHGTNAAAVISPSGEIYFQSRERIITPESDNAGFAQFATVNFQTFETMLNAIKRDWLMESEYGIIYGEWAGGNIQAGVGLNHIPKTFFIFGIAFASTDSEGNPVYEWLNANSLTETCIGWHQNIRVIHEFPTYQIKIDPKNPALVQNELIAITEAVEKDCPVSRQILGKSFEGELIGEGVVWQDVTDVVPSGFKFKVKGSLHVGNSRVRTLASVDPEKLKSTAEFIELACSEGRMQQGIDYLKEMNLEITMKNIGEYLKWINKDIIKEELSVLEASGITMKDVGSGITIKVKQFYMQKVQENAV